MIDEEAFNALPKARKKGDVRRMRFSPDSEDWLTWNGLRLLKRERADDWWQHLIDIAAKDESRVQLVDGIASEPETLFWSPISSPREYLSGDLQSGERSEGDSEVELQFRTEHVLVFAEAKLQHDMSTKTSHDKERDQIARNIDCLLSIHGDRRPVFWMLVNDLDAGRKYVQTMRRYRDVDLLAKALPHRVSGDLEQISQTLAILPLDIRETASIAPRPRR